LSKGYYLRFPRGRSILFPHLWNNCIREPRRRITSYAFQETYFCKNGGIIIPLKLRKALDLQAGDGILMRLENGSVRLLPLRQAVALVQKHVRQYVPEGVSLVDTQIQEHRDEATRE
jgi:bifunctional DNA-binding transcriptional regulator/antitoxin component of YhaV-PrlF toxin-antitoxin module